MGLSKTDQEPISCHPLNSATEFAQDLPLDHVVAVWDDKRSDLSSVLGPGDLVVFVSVELDGDVVVRDFDVQVTSVWKKARGTA